MRRNVIAIMAFCFLGSCGKGAQDVIGFLCGVGNDTSALTIGFDLSQLANLGLVQDNAISNTRVKDFLNELIGANVGSDVLSVKSVDTAVPEDTTDSVRFISLSGTLAGSFGVVSQYFRNALGSASLNGTSVFNYINESFNVSAAVNRIPEHTPLGGVGSLRATFRKNLWGMEECRPTPPILNSGH